MYPGHSDFAEWLEAKVGEKMAAKSLVEGDWQSTLGVGPHNSPGIIAKQLNGGMNGSMLSPTSPARSIYYLEPEPLDPKTNRRQRRAEAAKGRHK